MVRGYTGLGGDGVGFGTAFGGLVLHCGRDCRGLFFVMSC